MDVSANTKSNYPWRYTLLIHHIKSVQYAVNRSNILICKNCFDIRTSFYVNITIILSR